MESGGDAHKQNEELKNLGVGIWEFGIRIWDFGMKDTCFVQE